MSLQRLESVRKIVNGISNATLGVANAVIVLVLIMFIYAIIGVDFFSGKDPANFGNFFRSTYTVFQMLTGESWSRICRNLMQSYPAYSTLYFVSFMIIGHIILMNVAISVILEGIVAAGNEVEDEAEAVEEEELEWEEDDNISDDALEDDYEWEHGIETKFSVKWELWSTKSRLAVEANRKIANTLDPAERLDVKVTQKQTLLSKLAGHVDDLFESQNNDIADMPQTFEDLAGALTVSARRYGALKIVLTSNSCACAVHQ